MLSFNQSFSIRPTPLPLSNPRPITVKCTLNHHHSDSNANDPAVVASTINNFALCGASKSRNDWQSSCAMLASMVEETKSVNLVPTSNLPKPLTLNDMYAAPMHGSDIRVAYQGVPGAYSESAACEVQLPIRHCLLALPGVDTEDLSRVISHPQALAQCELTITELGLNVTRESFYNTAGAAEFVAENNLRDTAAIASHEAAKLYGLNVLLEDIHDDSNNVTRFVMLAREPIIPRIDRPFRTSIVFAHNNRTAVLYKVLSVFAFRNINLTKIESRPHRSRPLTIVDDSNIGTTKLFEYVFYVDFEASLADIRAQNALADVQEFTTFLRVLGSYPIDMTP
nr:arogenate dehydratase/prephenate dehydratase 6, chloroplastic-like [Tanacetum cinerariifolium]